MHGCPRSEECCSLSLCSCSNAAFLRSLRVFRRRSACHIQLYYPRLFGRWSLAGEVRCCWDVTASRSPWRTCILQRWAAQSTAMGSAADLCTSSVGRDQPGKVGVECLNASTLDDVIGSVTGLFTINGLLHKLTPNYERCIPRAPRDRITSYITLPHGFIQCISILLLAFGSSSAGGRAEQIRVWVTYTVIHGVSVFQS